MKPSLRDRLVWYKFRPYLYIWFTKSKGKTLIRKFYDETWYGEDGELFVSVIFIYIQFKLFAMHIKFTWWQVAFRNRRRLLINNVILLKHPITWLRLIKRDLD